MAEPRFSLSEQEIIDNNASKSRIIHVVVDYKWRPYRLMFKTLYIYIYINICIYIINTYTHNSLHSGYELA